MPLRQSRQQRFITFFHSQRSKHQRHSINYIKTCKLPIRVLPPFLLKYHKSRYPTNTALRPTLQGPLSRFAVPKHVLPIRFVRLVVHRGFVSGCGRLMQKIRSNRDRGDSQSRQIVRVCSTLGWEGLRQIHVYNSCKKGEIELKWQSL